jgi:glutathione S-transferase
MMLTFYFAPGSSSMAPHIGLHEVGAAFEPRPMSFKSGDLRQPEYVAINPEGKVPTLLIDDGPLTEVAAILYYLARAFPAAELLPTNDPQTEAQAISWMSFIASSLHPARRRGLDHVKIVYGIADKRLGRNEWAIGRNSRSRIAPSAGALRSILRRRDFVEVAEFVAHAGEARRQTRVARAFVLRDLRVNA